MFSHEQIQWSKILEKQINKQTKTKKKTRQARDDTLNRTAQHADPHHDRAIPLKALSHQSQLI